MWIVGSRDIIEASLDISEEELQRARKDNSIKRRVYKSLLRDVLPRLVDLLETNSEESQSLGGKKDNLMSAVIDNVLSQLLSNERTFSKSLVVISFASSYSQPRFPVSYQTRVKGRHMFLTYTE